MYRRDLQRLLQGKYLPNFFALYGGESFQIELFAEQIKAKFAPEEALRLFFEEYDFRQGYDYLALASLFASKKLLEVKCTKKPSKKDLEHFISLCKKDENNFFLLEIYGENSRLADIEKIFENNFVRFFAPSNAREGTELLALRANALNITFTQNALHALYANFDENLYLAAAELNKFKGFKIDENFVREHCFSLSVVGFDAFFDKILRGETLQDDLDKILDNFNEIALLNSINSSFYRLFKIALYAKIHGDIDLKALLGYAPPPQIAQKMSTDAFKISLAQYHQIFRLLLESEFEIKTNSRLIKREYLIAVFLSLRGILRG